jgi:hypothetical protein
MIVFGMRLSMRRFVVPVRFGGGLLGKQKPWMLARQGCYERISSPRWLELSLGVEADTATVLLVAKLVES